MRRTVLSPGSTSECDGLEGPKPLLKVDGDRFFFSGRLRGKKEVSSF